MKKTTAKKRITKPPLDRFGGVRVVQRRIQKSEIIEQNKDGVAQGNRHQPLEHEHS